MASESANYNHYCNQSHIPGNFIIAAVSASNSQSDVPPAVSIVTRMEHIQTASLCHCLLSLGIKSMPPSSSATSHIISQHLFV